MKQDHKRKIGSSDDVTGQRFGNLRAISFHEINGGRKIWKFACDCGNDHFANLAQVKHGTIQSCGCKKIEAAKANFKDIQGKKFGRLTVTSKADVKKRGAYWECLCDCGNTKIVKGVHLRSSTNPIRSCGCLQKDSAKNRSLNLIGKRFNRLKVISRSHQIGKSIYWNCDCDCGGQIATTTNLLRRGKSQSCGCLKNERLTTRGHELSGATFGAWLVLEKGKTRNAVTYWKCRCICGTEKSVNTQSLINGLSESCGCGAAASASHHSTTNSLDANFETLTDDEKRKILNKIKRQIRSSLRRGLFYTDSQKKSKSFQMLGYSPNDLIMHLESLFHDGMTWKNYGEWHIDHIQPLANATTHEEIFLLNQLENLQPLWAEDNLRKNKY